MISKYVKGVLICVPTFRQNIAAQTTQSLCNLVLWLTANKIPNSMCWMAMTDIAMSRNLFLTTWYDGHPEFSHILFVDDDMEFPVRLVQDMLTFAKPVVGCIYARRQHPAVAVGKMLTADDTVDDVKDGFLKVEGVGAGVLLIERHAIRTMMDKMPDIIDADVAGHPGRDTLIAHGSKRFIGAFKPMVNDDGDTLSEDLSFCARWRKCDGEIWANVEHLIGHIGPYNFAIRYADYLETKARDKAAA